ncbi:XRE family transcriptional regulator [Leptolyngbyaceae cyanobacterium CCMR0082]|uniref:XRE family transcriptional regulator n=1 Tax=Adonisia turfae CCMR0082 TaxID=2304604 RepID=A0A6M0S9V0_9CYAN|nr:helix-turn-helix transcriptional regulator [Adonisia turfae]NEZ65278.1 XRE family transcriptional regulator [Adonisia turfae CCMR0082]
MITFHLGGLLSRYKVTGIALANEIGVDKSTVSRWRQGSQLPSLGNVNQVLIAIAKLGDEDRLKAHPPTMADALEWHLQQTEKN